VQRMAVQGGAAAGAVGGRCAGALVGAVHGSSRGVGWMGVVVDGQRGPSRDPTCGSAPIPRVT
jgi:hypothetical protein